LLLVVLTLLATLLLAQFVALLIIHSIVKACLELLLLCIKHLLFLDVQFINLLRVFKGVFVVLSLDVALAFLLHALLELFVGIFAGELR